MLDFKDERATKELTRALLHSDHGIDWWVPKGHLIPPLTNRLNYIHWLEDLMELSKPPGLPRRSPAAAKALSTSFLTPTEFR